MRNNLRFRLLLTVGILLVSFVVGLTPVHADSSYVVRRGDTLYSIGRRFGISANAIASFNMLVNPNLIYAGQVLRIPGGGGHGDRDDFRPLPHVVPVPAVVPTVVPPLPTGPVQLWAWVSDTNPPQGGRETIMGQITRNNVGLANVPFLIRVWFFGGARWWTGTTRADGIGYLALNLGDITPAYFVAVDVEFTYGGRTYRTTTGFVPRAR